MSMTIWLIVAIFVFALVKFFREKYKADQIIHLLREANKAEQSSEQLTKIQYQLKWAVRSRGCPWYMRRDVNKALPVLQALIDGRKYVEGLQKTLQFYQAKVDAYEKHQGEPK